MQSMNQEPSWWTHDHVTAWDRIKEAVRRDWEQTKHDLHIKGGHELNQSAKDTVKQAAGKAEIPMNDRPNPPKVIGSWDDVEMPIGYGYGARRTYGADHPRWNDRLEAALRRDWESIDRAKNRRWEDVRRWVRHGYEYREHN